MLLNPLITETNNPEPVPLDVFVANDVVGFGDVLQQTPLAVTESPPELITFPPVVICCALLK